MHLFCLFSLIQIDRQAAVVGDTPINSGLRSEPSPAYLADALVRVEAKCETMTLELDSGRWRYDSEVNAISVPGYCNHYSGLIKCNH